MSHVDAELIALGAGPSNLALAVALEELAPALADRTVVLEQHETVEWQRGMLMPWARTQVSFVKDLVTLRNPRSRYSFLNYLHATGRLHEFVNLDTFRPYRREVSDYLKWVAESLVRVRIECGRRCAGVEPQRTADGLVEAWLVRLADGSTMRCRDLVVGTGRDPHIPPMFAPLSGHRVVHSSRYREFAGRLDPAVPYQVVVVGGAQSAVELLWAVHQDLPLARCTLITRSTALRSYEHSKFANEIYFPSFVDGFYSAPPVIRQQVLNEMRGTNYGAADPEFLDALYRQMYLERMTGTERLHIRTMSDVVAADDNGDRIELTVVDRRTGQAEQVNCDVVLLGTGYAATMPWLVRRLTAAVGLEEVTVTRNYRLPMPDEAPASCYLQGVNETTHGIADSLMSVLAIRAGEIVTDLLIHRARREPAAVTRSGSML